MSFVSGFLFPDKGVYIKEFLKDVFNAEKIKRITPNTFTFNTLGIKKTVKVTNIIPSKGIVYHVRKGAAKTYIYFI